MVYVQYLRIMLFVLLLRLDIIFCVNTEIMGMITFNYLPSDIISEKIICYYTRKNNDEIILDAVIELTIQHPDGPAVIFNIITEEVARYKRTDNEAASSVLLEAIQNLVSLSVRGENGKNTSKVGS